MWISITAGLFLAGNYIYRGLIAKDDVDWRGERLDTPIVDEGSPTPMLFGETRIRQPVMAWNGPLFWSTVDGEDTIQMNVFYVLASGFEQGENLLRAMYFGDIRVDEPSSPTLAELTGNGSNETPATIQFAQSGPDNGLGLVEFLNGNPDQVLADSGAQTHTATRMLANLSESQIPGYRGVLSACLFDDPNSFNHGTMPSLASWHFVASSLRAHPALIDGRHFVGRDANPVNVIYEVLTGRTRCLGLPTSMIDTESFRAAQSTLYTESLGYSRCFTERMSGAAIIEDVLRHIDGIVYFDPTSSTIKIKLIRSDYAPDELFEITKDNCSRLAGFAMGARTDIVNKVTVRFPNREKNYDLDTVTAMDLANAVGQDGQVAEEVIEFLGCTEPAVAAKLASRELAMLGRSVVKMRAEGVHRSALRLQPGDAIRVTWKNPDISNAVFRVLRVDRGTLEDGSIALDLVSDTGYVWRGQPPQVPQPPITGLPTMGG